MRYLRIEMLMKLGAFLAVLLYGLPLEAQTTPFVSAAVCAGCHSDLPRPAESADAARLWVPPRLRAGAAPGETSIAPFALWSGSMKAHAARDPYWRAKVRFEAAATPAAREVIEDKCLSCHAPQQQYPLRVTGAKAALDALNSMGEEGVACTVCHQVTDQGLGTKQSFTAGFVINTQKLIFGPHADPFAAPMRSNSGYTPTLGPHTADSSLCASCHTVITPTLTAAGEVAGEFIEQSPYLEWLRSAYPGEGTSCQSCHMPTLKDEQGRGLPQYIAHTPGGGRFGPTAPRTPFGMHFFSGGNVQVLGMLKALYPQEAGVLDLSLERARQSLSGAVGLRVTPRLSGSTLGVEVEITNRTGHKLPTAYPSRRLWLHVLVRDRSGAVVFESGAVDGRTGELRGLGEGTHPAFEPHYRLITREDQVLVYEAEMRDPAGNHTVSLLRAAGFLKDNRILPRGYQSAQPLPEGIDPAGIAPVGVDGDPDFLPGSDQIQYQINVGTAAPPFRVTVEALFQSVKPSHLGGLDAGRSREEDAFLKLYVRHKSPALVSRQELVVAP